jgi:hypothetical protein
MVNHAWESLEEWLDDIVAIETPFERNAQSSTKSKRKVSVSGRR